jgi:hypothetical protein
MRGLPHAGLQNVRAMPRHAQVRRTRSHEADLRQTQVGNMELTGTGPFLVFTQHSHGNIF